MSITLANGQPIDPGDTIQWKTDDGNSYEKIIHTINKNQKHPNKVDLGFVNSVSYATVPISDIKKVIREGGGGQSAVENHAEERNRPEKEENPLADPENAKNIICWI